MALNCNFVGWMENAECGVWKMRSVWKTRSMENEERMENAGYWNMRSMENAECGNAITLTDLSISKHFNAFIQHKKCLEMFYS